MAKASISNPKKGGGAEGGASLIQRCETDGSFKGSLINLCRQYLHSFTRLFFSPPSRQHFFGALGYCKACLS